MMTPLLTFPFFYIAEVCKGVWQVALDVLRPTPQLAPMVLRLPVEGLCDRQRVLLACLISMTPGSLAIGEDEGGQVMLVHCLYAANNPELVLNHWVEHYFPFVKSIPI